MKSFVDPVEDAKEFWDFSYAEMGLYDAPVNLNFIRDTIGPKPITYIGFAEGATSILYGMGDKNKSIYFKQLLTEVVLLAPCVFLDKPMMTLPNGEKVSFS